jgi:uncharacterized protein DUF6894
LDNPSEWRTISYLEKAAAKSKSRDAPLWALPIPDFGNMARRPAIPHYYFHVRRGQITILDHEGIVLADAAHAKVEAVQLAQQLVNGEAMKGASMNRASASRRGIIVADDNWETLFEFPF